MRRFARLLLVTIAGGFILAIVSGVAGEFFIEAARERGWYDHPSQRLDAAMNAFSSFVTTPWFLVIAAALSGLAMGAWLDVFLKRSGNSHTSRTIVSKGDGVSVHQSNDSTAQKEDFPPQYDELLAFFLTYLAPVIYSHRKLREEIIETGVDNGKIRALASQSLSDENLDKSFSVAAVKMTFSPAQRPSFRELTTAIHNSEFSYQECIDERDALACSLGLKVKSDERLFPLWEDWRIKHNALVTEYENIKRDQRFDILFRPFKESKWGGLIPPV